jgi:hypothetical protein
MRLKYRDKTKALYKLKITLNIIFTYLEYQNSIRRQSHSQSFVFKWTCLFLFCTTAAR